MNKRDVIKKFMAFLLCATVAFTFMPLSLAPTFADVTSDEVTASVQQTDEKPSGEETKPKAEEETKKPEEPKKAEETVVTKEEPVASEGKSIEGSTGTELSVGDERIRPSNQERHLKYLSLKGQLNM